MLDSKLCTARALDHMHSISGDSMGSGQSQNEEEPSEEKPKVIRIERADIPEEYKMVGVSHDIVDRILKEADSAEEGTNSELRRELLAERSENQKLREQIRSLVESRDTLHKAASEQLTLVEMEERKKAFTETLERIEKQYFSYHPENACRTYEEGKNSVPSASVGNYAKSFSQLKTNFLWAKKQDIIECVSKNKHKLLNCTPVVDLYKKCAAEFRQKVLDEAQKSSIKA